MLFYEIPGSLEREIKDLGTSIKRYRDGKISSVEFKGIRVPFGIYEQRKEDTYMVRIRCASGGITPAQLIKTAELSEKFGSGILHVTTRQEVQIHNVKLENIEEIMNELLEVKLSTRGGGGNTVRNITASVDSGINPNEIFDVEPYAIALTSRFISEPNSWALPRKLKIAFSSTKDDSANAAVQDIGFIASAKNGAKGFKVYIAGGMGIKPRPGDLLHEFIEEDMVYNVALAIKELFNKKGNRKNKHAARLRFLYEKKGREEFLKMYTDQLALIEKNNFSPLKTVEIDNRSADPALEVLHDHSGEFKLWKKRFVTLQKQEGLVSIKIPLKLGDLKSADAVKLARFLEPFGDNVIRFSVDQNIHIRNIHEKYLGNVYKTVMSFSPLSKEPAIAGSIVSCAGANTCKLGLCLSRGAAEALYRKLGTGEGYYDKMAKIKINISGCPNSCGRHQIADIGFSGKPGRKEGRYYPAYNVLAGAVVKESGARLAEKIGTVSARDLPHLVYDILKDYAEKGGSEDFSSYFSKNGKASIRSLITKYGNIPSFNEDKNYYSDWGAEDIFSVAKLGKGECSASLFDMIDYDVELIKKNIIIADNSEDENEIMEALYNLVFSSSRMLLITRAVESGTRDEIFDNFIKYFIDTGLIKSDLKETVLSAKNDNLKKLMNLKKKVFLLADSIMELYDRMDDSLNFPDEISSIGSGQRFKSETGEKADRFKDLSGVKCPLNFVKTKLILETMDSGETLEVILDDGEPAENVPRSVELEGHTVVEQKKEGNSWSVVIKKK